MAGECAVITLLLLFAMGSFLRAKRFRWAIATLPLLVIPVVNAVAPYFCFLFGIEMTVIGAFIMLLVTLILSCTWHGFLAATLLSRRRMRVPYILGCVGFELLLAVILSLDYYNTLVA